MVLRPGSKGEEEEEGGLKQRELREAQGQLGPHWALSNPETPARVCYGQVTCPLSQVTCMHPSLPLSALTPLPLEPEDPWVRVSRFTHSPSANHQPACCCERSPCAVRTPHPTPHDHHSSGCARLYLSTLHGAGATAEQLEGPRGLGAAAPWVWALHPSGPGAVPRTLPSVTPALDQGGRKICKDRDHIPTALGTQSSQAEGCLVSRHLGWALRTQRKMETLPQGCQRLAGPIRQTTQDLGKQSSCPRGKAESHTSAQPSQVDTRGCGCQPQE